MIDEGITGEEFAGTGEPVEYRARAAPQADAPPYSLTRARWMFWTAFGFLAIVAMLLPHGGADKPVFESTLYHPALPLMLAALWLVVLVDGVAGYVAAPDRKRALRRLALVCLVPPFRMTVCPRHPNDWVWLPLYGWLRVSNDSVSWMEQRTAVPMLITTAMIVPVLIVDFGFGHVVDASLGLQIGLGLLMATIWFSFALEFAVMVSLAPRKLAYCKKHWINVVIVILPLFAFLRTLQLFNFLRIAKASKLAKAYRLRGLATRSLKIALALNLIERLMSMSPERYVASLEEKIAEKQRELDDLNRRLVFAREKAAERAATRATGKTG